LPTNFSSETSKHNIRIEQFKAMDKLIWEQHMLQLHKKITKKQEATSVLKAIEKANNTNRYSLYFDKEINCVRISDSAGKPLVEIQKGMIIKLIKGLNKLIE
jgi:hypothetical protein